MQKRMSYLTFFTAT